ncbi:hypothetical protein DNTS_009157 [Danionella cerebrum]|uniref:EGF-like domain-containing protein n=1 Tax=Danionella cerebrum TaxID=2873325 RepID=A0A553QAW7_9TELE|nr:hypothetical protein DNTS_009157 [Danionella translucida]TRY87069.1 hypothetical protein DNTS_009157 [Danionella translucida]
MLSAWQRIVLVFSFWTQLIPALGAGNVHYRYFHRNCYTCFNGYHTYNTGHMRADIDECQVHNGGCQHRCVNTRGSYYCECKPGFRLHVDGRTCLAHKDLHLELCVQGGIKEPLVFLTVECLLLFFSVLYGLVMWFPCLVKNEDTHQ